ncbi:MipA/OmpV family protein [Roseomonas sp. CCTCC AB2023176]|uniref:MipA/OmpV family protein n=1 Tax=Roseomonas sp. CCTCC AB2023176 TaxID=3342640 RepID=UPI0035D892BC
MRGAVAAALVALLAGPAAAQVAPFLPAAAAAPETPAGEVRLPVFEAGIAGGVGSLPDYPAADRNRVRGIALPYVIYRGDILRADDQGVRGRLLRGERIGLDLSFSGAVATSSDDNPARRGMPDLDWLGEVGPALRITLWRQPDHPRRVNLELPVRAVFSTDLTQVRFRGFTFSPELAFEDRSLIWPRARFRVGIGPIFATERFQDYFYEVAPRFALPTRPAYDAKGGYLGARAQFSYRVPVGRDVSVVLGGRVENFSGAANADSPLHRRDWNVTGVAGFAWSFYTSTATVASSADPFD